MRTRLAAVLAAAVVVSGCQLNSHGPWVNEFGQQMQGNQVIEFDGFSSCEQEKVIFLRFFGDQYAKDPEGVLGTLTSQVDGRELSFEVLEERPPGLEGTDITHAGREILVGDDRPDYLYVRLPSGDVERWPRAEVDCVEK